MGDFDKKWCKHFMRTTTAAKQNSRSFSELKKKKDVTRRKRNARHTHAPRVHYHTSKKVSQVFTIKQKENFNT